MSKREVFISPLVPRSVSLELWLISKSIAKYRACWSVGWKPAAACTNAEPSSSTPKVSLRSEGDHLLQYKNPEQTARHDLQGLQWPGKDTSVYDTPQDWLLLLQGVASDNLECWSPGAPGENVRDRLVSEMKSSHKPDLQIRSSTFYQRWAHHSLQAKPGPPPVGFVLFQQSFTGT